MAFVHNELKALFVHNPKCGGVYVRERLMQSYGFTSLTDADHPLYDLFVEKKRQDPCIRDVHTIRNMGKVRYFLMHPDVEKDIFKTYFTFTFVRNPYAKIYSAYQYCNKLLEKYGSIRGMGDNIEYYVDFNAFIRNRDFVNNIAYFHAIITQYNQLIDSDGHISMDYLGRTETLDEDFIRILYHLGIRDMNKEHIYDVFSRKKTNQTTLEDIDIATMYDEDSFRFVNETFDMDFRIFGYKKYDTFEEFQQLFFQEKNMFVDMDSSVIAANNKGNPYSLSLSYRDHELLKYKVGLQKDMLSKYNELVQLLFKKSDPNLVAYLQDDVDFLYEQFLLLNWEEKNNK